MTRATVIASAAAGSLLLASTLASSRGAERQSICPGSLMPAYLHPPDLLRLAARSALPELVVVNPASGPGAERDDFRTAVAAVQAAGARVLGYVPTGYGARAADDVRADIDRYRRWYGVDGIFFDETASAEAQLPYYAALAGHARVAGARIVVLNPGVVPARGYFDFADVVVTYEGPVDGYAARVGAAPSWLKTLPPARVAHLVYAASRREALAALDPPPAVGYVYLTSGTVPHPWGTVPDYLSAEQQALGGCR